MITKPIFAKLAVKFSVDVANSSVSFLDLRGSEELKIHCGKQHFEALGDDIGLRIAAEWNKLKVKL